MSQAQPSKVVQNGTALSLDGTTPFTRHEHWRLRFGQNTQKEWVYLHSDEERNAWPQSNLERHILGIPVTGIEHATASTPLEAAVNGFNFMKAIQAPDGHWPGVCGGQMYLVPMYVISLYLCGTKPLPEQGVEMVRYLLNRADPVDGGWGLHLEHKTTVFSTSVAYISLRMLGLSPDHPAMTKARNTLHRLGGAIGCPAWGKFWLSLLNLYDWAGSNPIPPEILLLPEWAPIHPSKWWIFMRAFYIPMSYLYRVRSQIPENSLILSLRQELFVQRYETIHWPSQKNHIAEVDNLVPHTHFLDAIYFLVSCTIESCPFPPLRTRALNTAYELIVMEDENTDYFDLISVSKLLQMLCRAHAEGIESDAVRRHLVTLQDFIWMGPDGMQFTATNGCQVWDTTFISFALIESGLSELPNNQDSVHKLLGFLDREQMTENTIHYPKDFRHPTKGGWPFSSRRENGYVVSDCTGEALKAVLILQPRLKEEDRISDRRLFDTVDLLLDMQSSDGGLPSYECNRGNKLLEMFNPAEIYDKIMIEYSYPECTTSVITGLAEFRKYYNYRLGEIDTAIKKGIQYLHNSQYPDGGWIGSWGICFTYGTWFALLGLTTFGETYTNSERVRKACHYLLMYQKEDGGWGESFRACFMEKYVQAKKTSMAQTSWAVMALMLAQYPDKKPVERAVKKVMDSQLPDGSWAPEAGTGIGIRTGVLPYPLYRLTFPIWMLGMADKYLKGEKA